MGIFSIKSLGVGIRQQNKTSKKSKKNTGTDAVAATANTAVTASPSSSDAFTTESAASASSTSKSTSSTITTTTSHPIMRKIELMQLEANPQQGFGRVLDAGTGQSSLNWIQHILEDSNNEGFNVTSWTAVTTSNDMHKKMSKYAKQNKMNRSKSDGVILGNWFNNTSNENDDEEDSNNDSDSNLLLEGEMYDTILVDYLIGAIEGSTPYKQDCIFERLSRHLKDGGRMYIIGLQPVPIKSAHAKSNLICEAKQLRDVCVTLAGYNCYREYPIDWVIRTIQRSQITSCESNDNEQQQQQQLSVIQHQKYPLLHSESDILGQLQLAKNQLNKMINGTSPNKNGSKLLVYALQEQIATLENKIKLTFQKQQPSLKYVEHGFDYLVVAEKTKSKQ